MLKFTVNDKEANRKIAALQAAMADMAPVFRTVGAAIVRRVNLCFKLGVDPWGKPWAALKIRKGQPLRDTGRLQRSISSRADSAGVTIGTNLKQAKLQQFGGTIEPKNGKRLVFPGPGGRLIFAKKVVVPGRPFLPLRRDATIVALPPDWSKTVVDSLRAYFRKEVA